MLEAAEVALPMAEAEPLYAESTLAGTLPLEGDAPRPAVDANGESELVSAASAGSEQLLARLLQSGMSPDTATASGLSALCVAAMNGHLSCVRRLIKAGATVDATYGRSKSSALLLAARAGNRAVCEALLEAGADPALTDAYGDSAESAAHRFEVEQRVEASNFAHWCTRIKERAAIIAAEPPPPVPLYPKLPREDLEKWHRSTDPTKMLWRPGSWVHQKRPATGPVVIQQRPRAFSSTGYKVAPRVIPVEESSLPAQRLSDQQELQLLQGAKGALAAARLAFERTELNPQVFVDDVVPTKMAMRAAVVDAASTIASIAKQEEYLGIKFPAVPTHLGLAPVYSSGLQRAAMTTPSAAASLYPMIDAPQGDSLSALLAVQPAPAEEVETEPEPEPEPPKGKKK